MAIALWPFSSGRINRLFPFAFRSWSVYRQFPWLPTSTTPNNKTNDYGNYQYQQYWSQDNGCYRCFIEPIFSNINRYRFLVAGHIVYGQCDFCFAARCCVRCLNEICCARHEWRSHNNATRIRLNAHNARFLILNGHLKWPYRLSTASLGRMPITAAAVTPPHKRST